MEISNFYIFVIFALVIALLAAVIQIFKSRQNKDRVFYTEEERRIFVATKKMMPVFAIALVIFFISALLWSFGAAFHPRDTSIFSIFHPSVVPMAAGRSGISWNNFFTNIGTLMFVGCGSVGIGAILGFLFGVPRTLEAANRAALADGKRSEAATQATLAANTRS
ncbi:hypothetical protein U8P76_23675 [Rhizobium johnstonii]|nr:hypothetical protein U8P76_23675 [Rhizobium johnstonii]